MLSMLCVLVLSLLGICSARKVDLWLSAVRAVIWLALPQGILQAATEQLKP